MALPKLFAWLNPKARRDEDAHAQLKANAEKALRMKQEARSDRHIPPHQTPNEGAKPDPRMQGRESASGAEAGFTPQFKRSRVARSGDAS